MQPFNAGLLCFATPLFVLTANTLSPPPILRSLLMYSERPSGEIAPPYGSSTARAIAQVLALLVSLPSTVVQPLVPAQLGERRRCR